MPGNGEPVTFETSKFIIILLLAVLMAITTIVVSSSHAERIDPQPLDVPIMARHESTPVMTAISAMYAPAENKEHWISLVGSGMTEGGCEFFKSNLADTMWKSQANHDASSAGYIADDVTVINVTMQVWRANLTIFEGSDEVSSSRRSLSNGLGLVLIATALFGGYYAWSTRLFDGWFAKAETVQAAPADEPPLMGLTALYSPGGERAEWER